MGALQSILKDAPDLFGVNPDTEKPHTAAGIYSFLRYVAPHPSRCLELIHFRCYLITHSHLDHINSLVISAGSLTGQRRIYARKQVLKDLETVFADRLWPKLASYKKDDADAMLLYTPYVSSRVQAISGLINTPGCQQTRGTRRSAVISLFVRYPFPMVRPNLAACMNPLRSL